ncbi:hypothetical protein JOC54_001482 [Alkalihalobacillus xiaoxiensis]|uniref:Sporulation lipoprotein YhcN/YlaJ n=1 Tax=Shouchella xiaoxiensis TaxID=766895 RepID=A0ABS2SRY0_9BACI|nr:hypothetical protein [Shouchella xiaoxiensis]MBM7838251.1 hypothetical protein [Shouchella xiaoxiensis]
MVKRLFVLSIIFFVVTGCTAQEDEKGTAFKLQEAAGHGQEASDRAKDELIAMDEVLSVRGIQYHEDLVMAVHVKQLDRFRLKAVRKEAFNRIKALYPDSTIHISTDKKIYKELEDAEEQIKDKHLTEDELKKKIKVIEKHLKG